MLLLEGYLCIVGTPRTLTFYDRQYRYEVKQLLTKNYEMAVNKQISGFRKRADGTM
jgi:hypothetical protein